MENNIFVAITTDYTSGSTNVIMVTTDFKYVADNLADYIESGSVVFVQVWNDNDVKKIFEYRNNNLYLIADFEGEEDNE